MPQARHGGSGSRSLDVCGSKFEGTGFEKEQIGHIQVPVRLAGSGVGRWKGLSARDGDAVALLEGPLKLDIPRVCIEDLLAGFGTRVILADDFKKPACHKVRITGVLSNRFQTYIEFVSVDILQINGYGVLPGVFVVDIANAMGRQIDLTILVIRNFVFTAGGLVSFCLLSQAASCLWIWEANSPFIETHVVLDKQQDLIR